MRLTFNKYPVDLIFFMIWSLVLIPIEFFNIGGVLPIVFGSVFVLFIPGYVLIFALFPERKKVKGINGLERVALGVGLSIALVPLIGLILNYTPWGIRLESVSIALSLFVICLGILGLYRWFHTSPEKQFILTFDISFLKSENGLERALTILIIISVIMAGTTVVYVLVTPITGDHYTAFYLLDLDYKRDSFQKNLHLGESVNGVIGILNHEYQTINYTIEIWLMNQTVIYDETTGENQTVYTNMWFVNKMTVILQHTDFNVEKPNITQWESNYSFPMTRFGSFKLVFLLYKTPTEEYTVDEDYIEIASQKINSAYRELHLWIDVVFTKFYLLGPNRTTETHTRTISIGENVTGITGIANHEYKTVDYTIEIWLVNQSILYNETLKENITTIHNLWFVDKITTTLEHTEQSTQWEQNYSFMITRTGSFKLAFLLFPLPTEGYFKGEDYIEKAKIKFISAYKEQNILINVK